MEFTTQAIAELLNGNVEGNKEAIITGVSKIEDGKKGTLSFLANPKYTNYIYTTEATAVIVDKNFVPEKEIKTTLIKVDNPYHAFATLLEYYFAQKLDKKGIEEYAYIHPTAKIGENVYIGAFAYIGENAVIGDNTKIYPHVYVGDDVEIGNDTTLFSGVKVYHNCKIGNNCTLHAGVIIGSDGFGFAQSKNQDYKKVPQVGNVIIQDFVEIGANTCVDRATLGSTVLYKGVKLDNLIQIAHNVEVGEHTVIAALAGISGSTKIGKNCMIGGQVGMSGHLTIADEIMVGAQSGIEKNVTEKGAKLLGTPTLPIKDYFKSYAIFRRLPQLDRQLRDLQREIEELKKQINNENIKNK